MSKQEIEPYDCVDVPRARVEEFIHEPFAALMDVADREGFTKLLHTVDIGCPRDFARLRSCRWTERPLILKQNW